jgi:hypothetical protein
MSYRVFVSEGPPLDFPDFAAMVIDESDYVFVVGDDELARIPVDDLRDLEAALDNEPTWRVVASHTAA